MLIPFIISYQFDTSDACLQDELATAVGLSKALDLLSQARIKVSAHILLNKQSAATTQNKIVVLFISPYHLRERKCFRLAY